MLRQKSFLLFGLVLSIILFSTATSAKNVEVSALANSSSGGSGKDTGIDIVAGHILKVKVNPTGIWSMGSNQPYSRKSNADGLLQYGLWSQAGLSARYGSLVGRHQI